MDLGGFGEATGMDLERSVRTKKWIRIVRGAILVRGLSCGTGHIEELITDKTSSIQTPLD